MNTKKLKRKLRAGVTLSLTFGASVTLALLSFAGAIAFILSLPVSLPMTTVLVIGGISGVLSLLYEGELFWQNFKAAWKKLIAGNKGLDHHVTKKLLLTTLPHYDNPQNPKPQCILDYEALLEAHHRERDKQKRKKVGRQIKKMEHFIARTLTHNVQKKSDEPYEEDLRQWLLTLDTEVFFRERRKQQKWHIGAKVLAVTAGVLMAIGTSYLIVDAMAAIPFLATITLGAFPAGLIVIASVAAGCAFAFQVYNAFSTMVREGTLRKWFQDIKAAFQSQGQLSPRKVTWAILSVLLVSLGIVLAICTLGTWKTIIQKGVPLFQWMANKATRFIFTSLIPVVTGIAGAIFNIQNTLETFDFLKTLQSPLTALQKAWKRWRKNNTIGQLFNPFRLLTWMVNIPVRILLFLGHIASIGMTADQVPHVPAWASATVGTTSELFEDMHYFVDEHHHDHDHTSFSLEKILQERAAGAHGHSHDGDLPTRVIRFIFTFVIPIYTIAALWDMAFRNKSPHSFGEALSASLQKMYGNQHHEHHKHQDLVEQDPERYWQWQQCQAMRSIDRYIAKYLSGSYYCNKVNIDDKKKVLEGLQEEIRQAVSYNTIQNKITEAKKNAAITTHRLFSPQKGSKTATEAFLDKLSAQLTMT